VQNISVGNSRTGNSWNSMALNKSSLSRQPWSAADDDKIKFGEFDRGVELLSAMARCERPRRPHSSWKSRAGQHRF
jgi:hypothetical protein